MSFSVPIFSVIMLVMILMMVGSGGNVSDLVVARNWCMARIRDLARNEEFSEIAVIHIYFTFLKKNIVICGGGGPAGKISR